MSISFLAAIMITAGMLISVLKKKLTAPAALCGGLLATAIFWGAGLSGIALLATFYILGVVATAWKINTKIQEGIAEQKQGERNAGQVFANAGAAGILSLLAAFNVADTTVLYLMIAGCFSAATADTLSSELGNTYGKRYYHLLSLRRMLRGTNGAVSAEGTLAGIMGSTAIALIYVLGFGWNEHSFLIVIIAGTIGNIADTLLGLTLENKGILKNNAVNFLNTAAGALAASTLATIW